MSLLELRVELPAQSRSFQIHVQSHWSIREIKEEIRRVCPGGPQVDGQRVIWRGRILRDEERVSDVWKVCVLDSTMCSRMLMMCCYPVSERHSHCPLSRSPVFLDNASE